jgi:hypothetical protein
MNNDRRASPVSLHMLVNFFYVVRNAVDDTNMTHWHYTFKNCTNSPGPFPRCLVHVKMTKRLSVYTLCSSIHLLRVSKGLVDSTAVTQLLR